MFRSFASLSRRTRNTHHNDDKRLSSTSSDWHLCRSGQSLSRLSVAGAAASENKTPSPRRDCYDGAAMGQVASARHREMGPTAAWLSSRTYVAGLAFNDQLTPYQGRWGDNASERAHLNTASWPTDRSDNDLWCFSFVSASGASCTSTWRRRTRWTSTRSSTKR